MGYDSVPRKLMHQPACTVQSPLYQNLKQNVQAGDKFFAKINPYLSWRGSIKGSNFGKGANNLVDHG
jgi:hypothetical protein